MRSACQNVAVVSDYLQTECAAGRVVGPLSWYTFPPGSVQISKFGVIPKGTPGKWRLIVDLSAPEKSSVNDGVDTSMCSLHYVRVEDAAREVKRIWCLDGQDRRATSLQECPYPPDDRWLLGMQWEGMIFVDTTLPFGLQSAPKIFTALADAVEWVLQKRGIKFIIHYLDDFLLVGGTEYTGCAAQLHWTRSKNLAYR